MSTSVLCPEIGRGSTLQDKQEEEEGTVELNHCHCYPDNYPVRFYDRNPKKENPNAEFEGHV